MKKFITLIVFCIIFTSTTPLSFADEYSNEPQISAESAILINAKTGSLLYEKNSHKPMYPASTTKIMTAILALENGNLNDKVVVDNKSPYEAKGSHIALEPGEILSLNDLLYALLIESANDSANVIARHISGSIEEFANLMNTKAKEIGAINTHFTNPSGLPDQNHTTTAYDMLQIAKYAMQNETFKSIVSKYKYTIPPTNKKSKSRYLKSSNELLYGIGSKYKINVDGKTIDIKFEGCNGIKTGYTDEAQRCLVFSAIKNNEHIIGVLFHSRGKNLWVDAHELLNYGFDNFVTERVSFKNEFIKNVQVEYGDMPYITGIVGQDLYVTMDKNRREEIKKNIIMGDKIQAPITKGQVLGIIEFSLDNKVIGATNIIATSNINKKAIYDVVGGPEYLSLYKKWWFWIIIIFTTWRIYISYKRKKRKKRKKQFSYNYRDN